MPGAVTVVTCPTHAGHAPRIEIQCGAAIPAFDQVGRMTSINAALDKDRSLTIVEPRQFGQDPIARVHDPHLISFLASAWERSAAIRSAGTDLVFADTFYHMSLRDGLGDLPSQGGNVVRELGRYCFDTITGIGSGTYEAAIGAVNTALTAAEQVSNGTSPCAIALCRPPGHHAMRHCWGGGCYLNNAAIAAQWLLDHETARVAILDLDFHHGNGTQSVFYDRSDVCYVSIHGDPDRCFPYFTGYPDERGRGRGRGHNLNITLPPGVDGSGYLNRLAVALDAIQASRADLLVVSLGFDTFSGDPLGDARLHTDDYHKIAAATIELSLPIITILEGGYRITELGRNLSSWIGGIRGGI
jgi:acetoin utilization deacetylase AcuC-like enzyme